MTTTTPHWPSAVGVGYDAADDAYARRHDAFQPRVGYDAADDRVVLRPNGVGYDIADDRVVLPGVGYDAVDDVYARHNKPFQPRQGMGDGSSDLATFDATMGVADQYFAAGDWVNAINTYQAAGQSGAGPVGPDIDAQTGGASQPLTKQAWDINSNLQAVNNGGPGSSGGSVAPTQADALSAQGFARQMQNLYHQAIAMSGQPTTPMTAPSSALTTSAQAVVDYINAHGCSQASLPVVVTFQGIYNSEGQTVLVVDGKYGPNTQMAVQRVLGRSPNDCFTGVAPAHGGGGGGTSTATTKATTAPTSSNHMMWWLIGGGVVAGGGAIAYAVHKRRKMRRR
jgi:hypothetical protein